MWHRLKVGTQSGIECGYQWRDIDLELFTSIATGDGPLGDTDAQSRDSSAINAVAANRTMYYLGVWDQDSNEYTNTVLDEDAENCFTQWAQEGPGA